MVVDSDGYLVKEGDILSFQRFPHKHFALAVDGDYAVHLTEDDDSNVIGRSLMVGGSSVGGTLAVVKREEIMKIAGRSKFFVTNDVWRKSTRSREEVVRRALDRVGERMMYNLVTFNCEHFVNDLVTGKATSQQVRTAGTVAAVVGAIVGAGIIGGVVYRKSGREEEAPQPSRVHRTRWLCFFFLTFIIFIFFCIYCYYINPASGYPVLKITFPGRP